MLFAACASTRPTSASENRSASAPGARAASRPPIIPERIVIGKTLARVIRSQRETGSICLSADRFCVRMISPQFWRADDAMVAPLVRAFERASVVARSTCLPGEVEGAGKEAHQRRARAPGLLELLGKIARARVALAEAGDRDVALALEIRAERVLGIVAARNAHERLARERPARREIARAQRAPPRRGRLDDRVAHVGEHRAVGLPDPRAREHVAGLEVQIEAGRVRAV